MGFHDVSNESLQSFLGMPVRAFDAERGIEDPAAAYRVRVEWEEDEIALALHGSTVLEQLTTLDLSSGILTDAGGEALLNNPGLRGLEQLDLHYPYRSEAMCDRMKECAAESNFTVDVSGRQEAEVVGDETYRVVEVGE